MNEAILEIQSAGLLTTVQDLGRTGYQRFGVAVAGAVDATALRVANILVGNREGAASLEITALGPKAVFLSDTVIAVTGADLGALIDGQSIARWQSVSVVSGSVLEFSGPSDGMRAYLALAGGIDVPVVMGSRATFVPGGLGGFDGRALAPGDVVRALPTANTNGLRGPGLPEDIVPPVYGKEHEVRVVLGPQEAAFTTTGVSTFLSSPYAVTAESDRMGCRLEGPVIEHESRPDIVSDATALGSIQTPGNGQPIVLLADRGTTGGYPKIATVISPDIGLLAQAMTGDTVRFTAVTVGQAHDILREQEAMIAEIKQSVGVDRSGSFSVAAEGRSRAVVTETGDPVARAELTAAGRRTVVRPVSVTVDGQAFEFEIEVKHDA
ncbi:MAG: KipI antagonist [Chloroflexi bacterium]|jgi:biotin-dependent carboxylase-like uncharacterized protein|nr:KipI antagonist [Chloroflexota bacterium]MDP6420468.1 biotin-dependent carboxyltransferase family protein [SAR202 cluster bacterium]HAL48276.1 KipI antagonist [Dehalococcoidia bacterium]MDP6665165.1 biotin-dependent carboxyltransferase family protein [SAR202 cluster bacterium]MDP6800701.1 biotin-dependent carboxyltransferase family protein [SAR202 cluster bacterium]|tara:strand:- start:869 stop:2011 length:1143 start_codon:yes stop_codon:yes gene_type:complete